MIKKKLVAAAALVMLLAVSGIAAERRISLDFQGVPLRTVLRILGNRTDKKLVTDSELAGKNIVLTLDDVTPNEAIDTLVHAYGLYYVRQPGTDIYIIRDRTERAPITVSHVINLSHSDASLMVRTLEPNLSPGGNIVADQRTNSIIINDIAENIHKIEDLVRKLDYPTPQVMIESRIIETNITDGFRIGMDLTDFTKVDGPDFPVYNQVFSPGVGGVTLKTTLLESGYNIDSLIEAIQTKTEARLLNNPKVLVLSNETASINVLEEVPYREVQRVTDEGTTVEGISFKEMGVSIEVTPYVNRDGTIIMRVEPSHSFQTGVMDNVPVIKDSRARTALRISDGQTVVIGGLIRESDSLSEEKVPLLGDIPILGYFFKSTSRDKVRSELTIFITARIVD